MIYKISIKEENPFKKPTQMFETFISTRVSYEKVKNCIIDATILKNWLQDYQNDSLKTVKELVDDVVKEEGGLCAYEEKLFNDRRPYVKSLSIENWKEYSWHEKVAKILACVLEGEGIHYTDVECAVIEGSCY